MVNIPSGKLPNTNIKAQIKIISLAHSEIIQFFPYDFEIDDSYKPEWGSYEGFGRMDPIMTYKRTTRDVNLSFNVVAEDPETAKTNFLNLQTLIKCLYPIYFDQSENITELKQKAEVLKTLVDSVGGPTSALAGELPKEIQKTENQITNAESLSNFGIQVMQKSPLFQISFMNLLNGQQFVAAITGFKHKMKFDAADTSFSDGIAIPGEFNINITFKVLHNQTPGTILNYGF